MTYNEKTAQFVKVVMELAKLTECNVTVDSRFTANPLCSEKSNSVTITIS